MAGSGRVAGQSIQGLEQLDTMSNVQEGFVIKVHIGKATARFGRAKLIFILVGENCTSDEIAVNPKPFDCSEVVVPMTKKKNQNIGSDRIVSVKFCAGRTTKCFVKRIEVISKNISTNYSVLRLVAHRNWEYVPDPDTSLPQYNIPELKQKRQEELTDTRKHYQFKKTDGLPAQQVLTMPKEERFSIKYAMDIFGLFGKAQKRKTKKLKKLPDVKSLEDLKSLYGQVGDVEVVFDQPEGLTRWNLSNKQEMDLVFANQRINGLNPSIIQLCTDPEYIRKIAVSAETLKQFIGGMTIEQAIAEKCLYVCDLEILEDAKHKESCKLTCCCRCVPTPTVCAPIGLFFVDKKEGKDGILKPVAIQLFQDRAADNPVFLPTDGWSWTLAKMWFNNADAAYHQAITHLGFTHLLMEGVVVTTHRQLSRHHPIFKMLAPHFLFLIAINNLARVILVNSGGIIDSIMNAGVKGSFAIIRKRLTQWRMDVDGTLPVELKKRGVEDTTALPNYHFRDDALRVYDVIKTYATDYVKQYYKTSVDLQGDWEIQAWAKELTTERDIKNGGCGLQGVPGNGKLDSVDDLITILTSVIYTCSAGHAAANFAQYDEYGFQPNYPGLLKGKPPKTKTGHSENDLVQALPPVATILQTMAVTKVLSTKDTKSLGDFEEVPTITDASALPIVQSFRDNLAQVSKDIQTANYSRKYPYSHVDPYVVPNAISI
ncbi:polyunsaturated fatty acid lipoxygenase ALOX8-like [Littorina saxatilis]|uniref:polyunsaturated fatty acid lipoxygenase ALOX8-like n=1 Tax=Littorina saxatilis TaxID=31220 RepID=UPI0038B4C545